MDARELFLKTLQSTKSQLEAYFSDFPEHLLDNRYSKAAMTPREILVHISEVTEVFLKECRGEHAEWGKYIPTDISSAGLLSAWLALREAVVLEVTEREDIELLNRAMGYLPVHESYHIGQLCLLRMEIDPEWNAYSIYS